MNTLSHSLLLLSLVMFLTNCNEISLKGDVTAEAIEPHIYINNQTNQTIYFFAGDEDDLARVDLDLTNYSNWTNIRSGEMLTIEYNDLAFYDVGDTRAWIYWRVEKGQGGILRLTLPYNK